MITTVLLVFKAIWSQLAKLLALAIEHWRIILPLLILGYCLYQYNAQVNRADAAVKALNQYINDANTARAERERENLQKDAASKVALAAVLADHQVSLAQLNLDRQRDAKKLKDLYEKQISANSRNWSDRVQLESAAGKEATGVFDLQEAADRFAEGLRDCDTAYTTLEKACQITTEDYNALWTAWDKECDIHGCN